MAEIQIKNVAKSFGSFTALHSVDMTIKDQEFMVLLGASGCGKTTLLRHLNGLLRPTTGRVWLFGEPLDRAHLDRVGYLPEERGLYTKMKVIELDDAQRMAFQKASASVVDDFIKSAGPMGAELVEEARKLQ